jgi:tetratricopeptide (TPR) repeat protein
MDDRLRQLITLGREHYQAREYDKAEKYLSQVVTEHRGFADIFNMLGVIYHSQGRFQQAQESFEESLKINPNYTEAALNLAVTYNDLGKYAQAREVYTKAIARSRAQPRSLDPFAKGKIANMHADLGSAYHGIGFYPESIREYQKALELCPTFVDLRTRLAGVYRDMGDAGAAQRELGIVKTTNPKFIPARVALGLVLFSLGRRDDAIREWEAVLAMEPTHKAAAVYLHMVRDDSVQPASASQGTVTGVGGSTRGPEEQTIDEGAQTIAEIIDSVADGVGAGRPSGDDDK